MSHFVKKHYNKCMENNDNIKITKDELLTEESFEKLSSFYSLFADPTRLSIICLLCKRELCVNDIAKSLDISQSRVSHQLAILRRADIVTYSRRGKQIVYGLTDNHIKDIFKMGLEHISEKDESVYKDRKIKQL